MYKARIHKPSILYHKHTQAKLSNLLEFFNAKILFRIGYRKYVFLLSIFKSFYVIL